MHQKISAITRQSRKFYSQRANGIDMDRIGKQVKVELAILTSTARAASGMLPSMVEEKYGDDRIQ